MAEALERPAIQATIAMEGEMTKRNVSEGKSGVYRIRNAVNGRIYIGSTKSFKDRWCAHLNDLRNGRHRAIDMQKEFDWFGEEAFLFEVVEIATLGADLMALEQKWLDDLRPFDPDVGYNTHIFADGTRGVKRREETKRKIAESNRGVPFTGERCRNISNALKNSPKALASLAAMRARKTPESYKKGAAKTALILKGCAVPANRRITFEQAQEVRALYPNVRSYEKLGRQFGISGSSIRDIILGHTYVSPDPEPEAA